MYIIQLVCFFRVVDPHSVHVTRRRSISRGEGSHHGGASEDKAEDEQSHSEDESEITGGDLKILYFLLFSECNLVRRTD